jgi:hypothetical protein
VLAGVAVDAPLGVKRSPDISLACCSRSAASRSASTFSMAGSEGLSVAWRGYSSGRSLMLFTDPRGHFSSSAKLTFGRSFAGGGAFRFVGEEGAVGGCGVCSCAMSKVYS